MLKRLRLLFFLALLVGAVAGVGYLVTNSQEANNRAATAEALSGTAVTESDTSATQLAELRRQQEEAAAKPTATPIVVTVVKEGPTVIVVQTSSEYSYTAAVTTEPSPSKARIRYSVVVPPGTSATDLAFRLEGGTDQQIGLQATTIEAQAGQYYTAHIVKKTDGSNGPVLGSTGQFQVAADQTVVLVFTFVPENPAP